MLEKKPIKTGRVVKSDEQTRISKMEDMVLEVDESKASLLKSRGKPCRLGLVQPKGWTRNIPRGDEMNADQGSTGATGEMKEIKERDMMRIIIGIIGLHVMKMGVGTIAMAECTVII